MSDREQLTYLRNNDLRAEIVRAVGGDPAPYETAETSYCLRKADLVRVAETLTSYDEPSELTLRELYDTLDAAVPGMDHSHNAGNTWGIARGNLKALHRAVNDDAPLVTDGGSDVCRDGTERKVCLDLFSGLGGFSAAFEDAPGWDVVTVDIKERFDVARMPAEHVDEQRIPYFECSYCRTPEYLPVVAGHALAYRQAHHDYHQQAIRWLEAEDELPDEDAEFPEAI